MSETEFPEPFLENEDIDDEKEKLLLSILKKRNDVSEQKDYPPPGPIKISVKTANATINKKTHIPLLCEKINYILSNRNKVSSTGKRKFLGSKIIGIKYTSKKSDNKNDKEKIIIKNSKSNENFYNSIEIIMKIREDKNINLKYFTNGKITCTGCKEDTDGLDAVNYLIKEIKEYQEIFTDNENKDDELKVIDYNIVNINANFFVGFLIDNHRLHSLLLKNRDKYQLFTDYAPDSYQGVKICYLWNENQETKNGICVCNKQCKYSAKKKNGKGENDCRRISVAVFSTGCILIAGAKTSQQLMDTYNYITHLLQSNYNQIVQYTINEQEQLLDDNYKRRNGVLLRKLKIKM